MDRNIRWGILAASGVAGRVVPDIKNVPGSQVVAVGARDLQRAKAFADKHAIPRAYGSYEELVRDPEVDVVYVSSVHVTHYEHARLALEHGKAVLVEKPFTMSSQQAVALVELAREKKLFLMEAMWTRCHPHALEMARLIRTGAIGHVRTINASLGPIGFPVNHRAVNPDLGGGILLECGIYPVSLTYHLIPMLGEPRDVDAWSTFTEKGIDDATTIVFRYKEGVVATLATSLVEGVSSGLPSRAFISGTKGWIDIPTSIFNPNEFTLHRVGQKGTPTRIEPIGNGYGYEAGEVVSCLREGRTESKLVPLDDTLLIMRLLDRIREKTGLRYPAEK
jgi:predicted dehydrogenase